MLKTFRWNEDKNKQLQQERSISFEEVISHIEQGGLLDILEHPNRDKYQNQQIYVVSINQYIYLVPFIDNGNELFLKTIFPSRKYTKLYLNREHS
jgi:uncharacterized DUF497 family protein